MVNYRGEGRSWFLGPASGLLFLDSVKRVLAAVEAPFAPAMGEACLSDAVRVFDGGVVGERSSAISVRLVGGGSPPAVPGRRRSCVFV